MRLFLMLLLAGVLLLADARTVRAEEADDVDAAESESESGATGPRENYPADQLEQNPARPGCSEYMCGDIQSYKPARIPRNYSLGWDADLLLCRHLAIRATPAPAREAVNEFLLRTLVITTVGLGVRSAVGQDFEPALDNSIISGTTSGAGGSISGFERAKIGAKRQVYACMRYFKHGVLPPS